MKHYKRILILWACWLSLSACSVTPPTPSETPSITPSHTLTPMPAPSLRAEPTRLSSSQAQDKAVTPSRTPTPTLTPTPTVTPSHTPSSTMTMTPTPTPSVTPSHTPTTPPSLLAQPTPVTLHTSDGLSLSAALYTPGGEGPFPAVLLSHMGGAAQAAWGSVPTLLQSHGYVALTYDFRGHGQSGGRLDPPNAASDLRAALAYLRSLPLVDEQRIGLVGASMGGLASVIVGADDPGVRAVAAISSSPDAAGQYPGRVIHLLSPRPFLALGCDQDPLTLPERVRQLYESAGQPKQIVILTCNAHANDILQTDAAPRLLELLLRWLDDYVAPPQSPPPRGGNTAFSPLWGPALSLSKGS